jgi:SAM-dependent methyltransferase
MNGWFVGGSLVGGALAVLWLLDGLRLRGRATSLKVLEPSDEPVSESHRFLVRPGVVLDEPTRRAASAHARKNGLEVLDLVPPKLASWRALVLVQWVDPPRYHADRVAPGVSAGDALLVDASALERARGVPERPDDAVAFGEAALLLKRYAATDTDIAVAPGLVSLGVPLRVRRRLLRQHYTDLVLPVVAAQLALLAFALATSPAFGLAALVALHLQPLLVTLGSPLSPWDRWPMAVVRVLVDALSTFGPASPDPRPAAESPAASRQAYAELLRGGVDRFFEPPREDCPLCGARALRRHLQVSDHYQFKPGRFTLSACTACRHVFQNPRLTVEGLDFYYRDFYDGLGGERLEGVFASSPRTYRERAQMVADIASPRRWLDVGAGHGHFCSVAREVLPDTRFDGLDLSASIEDAARRHWVDRALRGLFPDLAPQLADASERYDVVSMSHYLEHTLDPRAEIAAASRVLGEGGLLFIEVPDPESRLGRLFGRLWMPWFQPQHLHFVSAKNLERLLGENGFEPLVWHRGQAHQAVDFTFLAFMLIEMLSRPVDLPWRRPSTALHRVWRRAIWVLGVPLLVAGFLVDKLGGPFLKREGWSNTYRVLARRAAT